MAKLPASLLKQLSARAKDNTEKIKSLGNPVGDNQVLMKANEKTGNYYLMYDDVIRSFLIAGYGESAAEKHIKLWNQYDLTDVWYLDRYKIIGFATSEIERAML